MGISFGERMVSLHIARILLHNCHIKHTKSKQLSNTVQLQHKCITNPSITHADKVMHALAECIKAIQGMMGKTRNSQAAQDLQHIVDATQAHVQTNPHKFKETITPENICNTQQVPRVQAPPSIPIPHTDYNKQITCSMHLQEPILRVSTDIPRGKPIGAPLVTNTIKPSSKPTTLAAKSSKRERHHRRQATRLSSAVIPTSPTTRIRT
jgi:hypothetical protein